MRLWSLHPSLLDRQGLTAVWREALLAQAVLAGRTRGYRNHPQLQRFRASRVPQAAVAAYLDEVWREARRRGYSFDATRIDDLDRSVVTIPVTVGQLRFELAHLRAKLMVRSPERVDALPGEAPPAHPLFTVHPGDIETWERP